jgi:hypothetical protein
MKRSKNYDGSTKQVAWPPETLVSSSLTIRTTTKQRRTSLARKEHARVTGKIALASDMRDTPITT